MKFNMLGIDCRHMFCGARSFAYFSSKHCWHSFFDWQNKFSSFSNTRYLEFVFVINSSLFNNFTQIIYVWFDENIYNYNLLEKIEFQS